MENMTSILTPITSFISAAGEWMTTVLSQVTSSPILFVMVICMPLAGYAIHWLKMLMHS